MKGITKLAVIAAGALALGASTASAEIVCNDAGDCWHVREHREFRPELRLHVYPDDWRWKESDSHRYRWREHAGHGYWRGGVWVDL